MIVLGYESARLRRGELGAVELFIEGRTGGLNNAEKCIAKRLLKDGLSNQDVHAQLSFGRKKTINFGRISAVKTDKGQNTANDRELSEFKQYKKAFDPQTGLHPFKDERLVKSREAMKMAISIFNNPTLVFKTEQFLVLSHIAWTYLAHQYAHNHDMTTKQADGKATSLSYFLKEKKCPLSDAVKNNLRVLCELRNKVEHSVLGQEDPNWVAMFQANCLNYENFISSEFGPSLSLRGDLSFALQFSGLSLDQAIDMAKTDLPASIKSINKELFAGLKAEELTDQEFRFSVVYTTVATSKSKAALQFVSPKDAAGKEIARVLVKEKPGAETHPHRASDVWARVAKESETKFNSSDHTKAWKQHEVRPAGNAADPTKTNVTYCYYNKPLKTYTYSEAWVEKLISEQE